MVFEIISIAFLWSVSKIVHIKTIYKLQIILYLISTVIRFLLNLNYMTYILVLSIAQKYWTNKKNFVQFRMLDVVKLEYGFMWIFLCFDLLNYKIKLLSKRNSLFMKLFWSSINPFRSKVHYIGFVSYVWVCVLDKKRKREV